MNLGGAIRINKCGVTILGVVAILLLLLFYNSQKNSPDLITNQSSSILVSNSKISQAFNDGKQISVQQLLIAAVDVAERGGREVYDVRQSSGNLGEKIKGNTKEGAKDRVTQGDFRSHRVMYYGLRKAFPHVKVISEEHDKDPDMRNIEMPALVNPEISSIVLGDEKISADDISIWIDPLDATQEYTENLLEYVTTMVCIAVKGVPIIGVIHRPFTPVETYWAVVGYGHSANLAIPKSKSDDPTRKVKVIASRSHTGPIENITKTLLGSEDKFEIIKAAGAGYKVLEIIKGQVDAYMHVTYIKKWDLCAGNAILNALEGVMVTLNGEKLDYSPDTDPVNTKGILAFMKTNEDKFKDLTLDIDA